MSSIPVGSSFNHPCPRCGGEMIITNQYNGGTATKSVSGEVSTSGSIVGNIYCNQDVYTCKNCGATLLQPHSYVTEK